jgi:hypothetical protein
MLSYGPRRQRRHAFVAGAAGVAWAPHRLLGDPCLADLDEHDGLALIDVLNAARAPYERALARERKRQAVQDEERHMLREDPDAMREHLRDHDHALGSYIQALSPLGEQAVALLMATTDPLSPDERGVLRALARDLDKALLEPDMHTLPQPGAAVTGEIRLLIEDYRAIHAKQVAALAVKPRAAFADYFTALDQTQHQPPKTGQKCGVTKAGATGVGSGVYPRMARRSRFGTSFPAMSSAVPG